MNTEKPSRRDEIDNPRDKQPESASRSKLNQLNTIAIIAVSTCKTQREMSRMREFAGLVACEILRIRTCDMETHSAHQ